MPEILTVKAQIEIPKVPNFLRRTDGVTMELCDFETEGLNKIAEEWRKNLIARAEEQRKQRSTDAR